MRKKRKRTGLWIVLFLLGICCIAFVTGQKKDREDTDKGEETIDGFMQTFDTIEGEAEEFIDQAKEASRKYGTELAEEANTAINQAVGQVVKEAVQNFFESIRQSVQDFFENLIST